MEQQEGGLVLLLPEDVVTDVLRRLAPRSLAVSRCVCKAWHAIIDTHRLLRTDLLPHSLGGILVDFNMLGLMELFYCPTPTVGRVISGNLSYTPDISIIDHCNGLLLLFSSVANPATREWAHLPLRPPPRIGTDAIYELPYLVFDPTISPHYEVFLIPVVPDWANLDPTMKESEWPPSLYETHVFSSRTGRWEERSFVRQGEPIGTMADMQQDMIIQKRHGVYWRGALYVHCQSDFFVRISLSNDKYQVIKPPVGIELDRSKELYLGKSKNGVYCARVDLQFRVRVWILKESSGHLEWVLKHQNNLEHVLASHQDNSQQDGGAWILEDSNYYTDYHKDGDEKPVEPKLEKHAYLILLGFHPFEEILFLNSTLTRGLAYDLNSSKVQDLGNMRPTYYGCIAGQHADIRASFPYTPCWMENLLPTVHLEAHRDCTSMY